jgi:hypothetical protein
MKKLLVLVMACLLTTWGCYNIAYVSQETGKEQLMSAVDNVPLSPVPMFVTNFDDSMPDVSHDGTRVAFKRIVGGVDRIIVRQVGDAAGTTEKDIAQGTRPRWSPTDGWILFRNQGKIFQVRPDGTLLTQITNPPAGMTDDYGHDYWNVSTIVFSRGTAAMPQTLGLYLQDLTTAAVTGPFAAGSQPVVSHDGTLLVSEVKVPTGPALFHFININRIPSFQYVNRFSFAYGPNPTTIQNISGIGFSGNDTRLLFSAVPPNETKRDLYSLEVNGSSGQTPLQLTTTNGWNEFFPDGYR